MGHAGQHSAKERSNVAKYNKYVIFNDMNVERSRNIEEIQRLTAGLVATSPAGVKLCLIGGFRYRLLNRGCRTSLDIDYHWDGDLDNKQAELLELLRGKLLPEVKRRFGLARVRQFRAQRD
jgi:hypothetical protein